MLIDADCHISPTPQGGNSVTIDQLLRRMDRSEVERALTWLQPPYERGQVDQGNAYVHEAMRAHPDRILGFGWADPNLGVERAKETARRCVEEYSFFGVKLNGAQNWFVIDDATISLPVVEEIAKLGVILALHIGADAYENTHPARAGHIAELFPEIPILMIHMGGAAFHDLSRAAIEVAQKHPNITIIGSAVRPIPILRAIKALGAERVCFGSDTPFELMHVELAKYRALLDGEIDAEGQAAIFGRNIARLLGLDA
ncbi:MAG: amidohydrolase family protein [Thermomicrobiales bacterium]